MPRPLGEAGGRRGGRASTAINGLIVSYSSVFTKFSHEEQPALPKGHAVLNVSARGQRAIERGEHPGRPPRDPSDGVREEREGRRARSEALVAS